MSSPTTALFCFILLVAIAGPLPGMVLGLRRCTQHVSGTHRRRRIEQAYMRRMWIAPAIFMSFQIVVCASVTVSNNWSDPGPLVCFSSVIGPLIGFCLYVDPAHVRDSVPGLCQQCGYDLTGNTSGRCPECGQDVGGWTNRTGSADQ